MKNFMRFILILLFIFLFPGKSVSAQEEEIILVLNPTFSSEFSAKLFEGLESELSKNNIKILRYVVNSPEDEFEMQNIKHIAEKNNVISIISLGCDSYELLQNYPTGYLDNFNIHIFDVNLPNKQSFPEYYNFHSINFDFEKKMNLILDLHKVHTINFLIDKNFLSSDFYPYIDNYMKKYSHLSYNLIYSDEWSKLTNSFNQKNSLTVVFSSLFEITNEIQTKITPFGSVEKIARFTNNPIYGGFSDFATRFNIGAFNYSGLQTGNNIAKAILSENNISDNIVSPKQITSDFLINEDLDTYKIIANNPYSMETYSFKGSTSFANEQKLNTFKTLLIFILIFVFYLIIKNIIVKNLYNEQIKIDSLKTNFIANISHELRTPLNIIISTISLFEVYIKNGEVSLNTENSIEKFNYLKKNSYRLLKLINNIIDTTRIDAGYFLLDKKNYNIVEIIEDTCLSTVAYAEKKNISLIFDTSHEEIYTLFDKDKIERVTLNLLSNALKFTPPGGNIYIFVDKISPSTLSISFKDTGVGISKDNQNSIFNRFVQASDSLNKSEGSGIGLSLCKSIALQHEGDITLQSSPGIGSTFTLSLPIIIKEMNTAKNLNSSKSSELTEIEFSDH